MPKKETEYCTYSTVKLDSQLLDLAKAAALLSGTTTQEWLSDLVNRETARTFNREPITRRKPKPRD